jgi:hypothetical protein
MEKAAKATKAAKAAKAAKVAKVTRAVTTVDEAKAKAEVGAWATTTAVEQEAKGNSQESVSDVARQATKKQTAE